MLENYENGDIDEVYIIYTNMKSSVVVEPQMIQLLPMKRTDFAGVPADVFHEEITMEPSPKAVLDRIVPNCVMGYIYGALVESFCSEQNSRMMAMDSATKSAKEMLDDLNIKYNRARQAVRPLSSQSSLTSERDLTFWSISFRRMVLVRVCQIQLSVQPIQDT